jgi:beta-lactamase class A
MKILSIVLAASFLLAPHAPAQHSPTGSLDSRIHRAMEGFPGRVGICARNLDTGAAYSFQADEPVPTASTIKFPIMIELFSQAAEGKLDWNQQIELTEKDKVSGSGILNEFSAGDRFTVRDLMHVMIVVSDNTATNLLLDRIGGDAVNRRMKQLGLRQTAVMRKIMQPGSLTEEGRKPENEKWGLGRSSPQEMVALMEKLYRGQLVSKEASEEMLRVLKRQRDLQGVGRDLPDTVVASKSGALDHLRSEVALVYSSHGPIAIAITVNGIPKVDYGVDNAGNLLISSLSQILIEELGK